MNQWLFGCHVLRQNPCAATFFAGRGAADDPSHGMLRMVDVRMGQKLSYRIHPHTIYLWRWTSVSQLLQGSPGVPKLLTDPQWVYWSGPPAKTFVFASSPHSSVGSLAPGYCHMQQHATGIRNRWCFQQAERHVTRNVKTEGFMFSALNQKKKQSWTLMWYQIQIQLTQYLSWIYLSQPVVSEYIWHDILHDADAHHCWNKKTCLLFLEWVWRCCLMVICLIFTQIRLSKNGVPLKSIGWWPVSL